MGLFNFLGKSNANSTKPIKLNTDSTQSEMKTKLLVSLNKTLSEHNFTSAEIKEVTDIIDLAENDIYKLKSKLLELKKLETNPTVAILKIKKEVEFIQQQMAADIKAKVRQIKARKKKVKKARI
ncbi:MAG: hypothetical protein ACI37T_00020 [Candidatus Gastranaerophilaceae bacterium]